MFRDGLRECATGLSPEGFAFIKLRAVMPGGGSVPAAALGVSTVRRKVFVLVKMGKKVTR